MDVVEILKSLEDELVESVEATRRNRMIHFTIKLAPHGALSIVGEPKEISFSIVDEKAVNDALDRIHEGLHTLIRESKITLKNLKEAD